MKILFVSQYFYPEIFKGNDIVFDLIERGNEVTVLTGKPNYPEGKFYKGYNFFNKNTENIKGAKVIRVPLFPRRSGRVIPLVLNYLSFLFFSYFVVLFRVRDKFDLIFVQQLSPVTMALPGLWVKKKQKIPLVLWVLDLWPESVAASSNIKNKFILNFLNKLVKKIYKSSDLILISSKFFKKSITNKCDTLKRIDYFPNWAEEVFTKNPHSISKIDNSIPKFPTGFNVVFAGNIGEAQDFESILNAAELTKKDGVNWILVGDGRKANWVKNEIKSRNISNIYLLGRYPLEQMPKIFRNANVMLVSLKNEPIFALTVPAKIQSYMASKKIIVGMLNGEGKELINDSKCGYAVNAEDFKGLAENILKLKKSSFKEIKKMETSSFEYYEKYFLKSLLLDELNIKLNELISNKL